VTDASRALATEYSQRAEAYAHYWAPVIHPMAHPLLHAMPLANAQRILDVGTGTGALWPLIQQAAPQAQLWGIDRAKGMLRAGADLLRGRVAVMDAERLGVRGAEFDAALFLFVLFHIPDPIGALGEVLASLQPAGVLGVVVWGIDPGLPGAAIWAEELDRVHAADDPRDPAVMRQGWMDTPEKLRSLLEGGSFVPDQVWSRSFVHQWTSGSLLATQTRCGSSSRRLHSLSRDVQQTCTERVRARLETLAPAELEYRVEAVYAIAHRPG
jgi:ubiquinone/menaquinone biosynthesis C-methylase UbiE